MISLSEVKIKSARKNAEKNNRLHFFASKFSIYFSWIFINLRMSPNQVTGVFFIVGLIGSMAFLSYDFSYVLIGYILWRLHIIIDLCDGDVARFTKKFSINGSYWDYMVHSVLYPIYFITISISLWSKFDDVKFLFLGLFGSVIVSQLLSVKNNYYRAMLFNGEALDLTKSENKQEGMKFLVMNTALAILSFEGFLLAYVAAIFIGLSKEVFLALFVFYMFFFLMNVLAKFYLFSKKGFYSRRS